MADDAKAKAMDIVRRLAAAHHAALGGATGFGLQKDARELLASDGVNMRTAVDEAARAEKAAELATGPKWDSTKWDVPAKKPTGGRGMGG